MIWGKGQRGKLMSQTRESLLMSLLAFSVRQHHAAHDAACGIKTSNWSTIKTPPLTQQKAFCLKLS